MEKVRFWKYIYNRSAIWERRRNVIPRINAIWLVFGIPRHAYDVIVGPT